MALLREELNRQPEIAPDSFRKTGIWLFLPQSDFWDGNRNQQLHQLFVHQNFPLAGQLHLGALPDDFKP